VIIAEAYRDAQKIKGEGDAKASRCMPTPSAATGVRAVLPQPRPTGRASGTRNDMMVVDPSTTSSAPCAARAPAASAAPGAGGRTCAARK
jgi:membrane protease subunit HflC